MKRHHSYLLILIGLGLLFFSASRACPCLGQTPEDALRTISSTKLDSAKETPPPGDTPASAIPVPKFQDSTPAEKESPKNEPSKKGNESSTNSQKTTDLLTSLWNSLNLSSLWSKNDYISWLILLGAIFGGMVSGKIVSIVLQKISARGNDTTSKILNDMAGPANLALITLGVFIGLTGLEMSDALKTFPTKTLLLMGTIAVFWYIYNLIGLIDILFHHLSRKTDSALDKQVGPLVRRTLRVFVLILGVMFIVESVFDKDIGAWLAGLGIAGIAVSLAAQDSLKNLFGSITIVLDRSFKIGDRIVCTGYEGTIEDIGFRSTKVRTAAGHLVSLPNANVVNSPIENISRRPGIRRNFSIQLASDTSAEKVKLAVQILRELLEDPEFRDPIHPLINNEVNVPQVVFGDFTNNNLQLTITYWYAPAKPPEFARHSEKINLKILERFQAAGISMILSK